AAGAVFQPPSNVTISFKAGKAAFEAVADSSATAYGSAVKLHWNKKTPVQPAGLPAVVVPCDAKPATFAFATVKSTVFQPSGSAPVTLAGWALPLSATSIGSLPEAAGPGAAFVQFGAGVSVANRVEPQPAPVTSGVVEISTG